MKGTTGDALHARFVRGLAVSPGGVAVRIGTESITYAQANELALLWGGRLAEAQARAVGILAAKSITAYVGVLAALYAGAAVVPLRPDFPVTRTRQMLDASGAPVLIADGAGRNVLPALLGDRRDIALLATEGENGDGIAYPVIMPDHGHALAEPRAVARGDAAYVLFTSGSTGRPKGVVITHGSADHYFRLIDARYDFTPDDVFSQAFDLNFDCAVFDMFAAWGAGATAVAVPPHGYRDLPRFIGVNGLTVWFSTPSVIDLARRMGGLTEAALPGLRWSFFAGEALKCRDAGDWQRAAAASTVENLYGPTELTITVAAHRWSGELSPRLAVNGVVPIGAVHSGHDYFLLGEDGRPAADEGELCVAGPQLTPGYLDPEDETGRFLERESKRWYRTGDRVRQVSDAELAYLGRLDSQVQVQGWRIELAEIEHALRACGVHDAVTVAVRVAERTELFAFYTGGPIATVELVKRLRELLPDNAIPRHYLNLEEFPLNSNRKIDRARLAAEAGERLAS